MNRKHAKGIGIFLLKLAGTTLFLFWALSMIEDKKALGENFRHALRSPTWVVAGISMAFLSLLANAFRWFFVLKAQDIRLPFSYIFRLTLYGAFFNIASFGSAAGDAAKIVMLMRRVPDKKVGVTVSVMMDHVIGFISSGTIFLVFAWGLGTVDQAKDIAGRNAFVAATWSQAGGLLGIFLTVLSCSPVMLTWGRRKFPRLTHNRWVEKISALIDLHRIHWRYAVWSLCASFVLSASFYLTFFVAVRSLGEKVEAATILSVMPVVDVVSSLPISISGLGVRERTFDFLISQLTGIPPAAAVAAALIGFLFNLFWGIVGGLAIITARHHRKTESANE
ncbi:MAG: lysylphosphatidylglycerol synthase transmembrane domain-containing protein [Akkermansiaceae bacterium]|jgi:uncharacterized membrane protein YbhN (UPF0104 family)|nr:flippase-like domain-containing protein [Luteolibacter sp.]